MKLENLKDLYIRELKDLHSAEKQITKALPKMAKAAGSDELATAFREHLDQTHEHIWRLEKISGRHGESLRGPKCKGMEGLLKEGAEMIEEDAENEVRDAGLISAAQRVEHYEIAAYGCARTYAELLGDEEGASLLKATLSEEKATDEKLTDIARSINVHAEVAEHIEEGYEKRGTSKKGAERRVWATVNKQDKGGKKSGSGRGKNSSHARSRKAGRKGGKAKKK
jgi:ferritin-like metal-binding protein YciE